MYYIVVNFLGKQLRLVFLSLSYEWTHIKNMYVYTYIHGETNTVNDKSCVGEKFHGILDFIIM